MKLKFLKPTKTWERGPLVMLKARTRLLTRGYAVKTTKLSAKGAKKTYGATRRFNFKMDSFASGALLLRPPGGASDGRKHRTPHDRALRSSASWRTRPRRACSW